MRRSGKLTFWPAYFDTDLTWSQGRRVSRRLSLRGVKNEEIFKAASDLSLKPVIDDSAAYPKVSWRRTGVVIVDKTGKKSEILKELARRIQYNRTRK